MKKILKSFGLLAFSALVLSSCGDEDTLENQELLSEEQTLAVVESETVEDELDNILDDLFGSIDSELSSKNEFEEKSQGGREGVLSCATKTVVITNTEKSITLDFGDGCETPKGDILKGIITMNFKYNHADGELTIVKSFKNFYFNDVLVEGSKTVVKTRSNQDSLPESVVTFDMKLTWEDGSYVVRTGSKTRTFIEGFDTRVYYDNVFSIVGSSITTFSDGTVVYAEITNRLIRKMNCRFIVSGEKTLVMDGQTYVLDFGDGTCDNLATLTVNGETTEFELRRRGH